MNIQTLASDIAVEGEYSLEGIDFITNEDQYLTFLLDNEQYAIDILCVEEIRSWETPTIIPNSPSYVCGVINMRGVIVPIIDLRKKFGVGNAEYLVTTVVVVLTIDNDEKSRTIGFVVDAVSDVLNASESEIKPSPSFGGRIPLNFIQGIVNSGDNVVTILNADSLQVIEPHKISFQG